MSNPFPELNTQEWEKIRTRVTNPDMLSAVNAIHLLVVALANLGSSVSSQVGYLNNKIERLQGSTDRLNETIHSSVDALHNSLRSADESSRDLAKALNRITKYGVIIAAMGGMYLSPTVSL